MRPAVSESLHYALHMNLNLPYSSSLKAAAGIPKQHEHIYADKKLEAGSYKPDGQGPSQMLLTSCSDQTRRPKRSISTQAPEKRKISEGGTSESS